MSRWSYLRQFKLSSLDYLKKEKLLDSAEVSELDADMNILLERMVEVWETNDFEKLLSFGELGESLVKNFLFEGDITDVYIPLNDTSNIFDLVYFDKEMQMVYLDVKTTFGTYRYRTDIQLNIDVLNMYRDVADKNNIGRDRVVICVYHLHDARLYFFVLEDILNAATIVHGLYCYFPKTLAYSVKKIDLVVHLGALFDKFGIESDIFELVRGRHRRLTYQREVTGK